MRTAWIAVFMLCFRAVFSEIVTKPAGTEAVVGSSTYFNCSTNSPQEIHWFHISVGSNQDRSFVYSYNQIHPPYNNRFRVERNEANGAYNLIIISVKVEDAGQYECQDQNGQGKKETAQLIVLDAEPACEPRMEALQIIGPNQCGIEPSQLILSCTVKYHGNEAPIMKWSKNGDKSAISEGVTHQITDNTIIIYHLTIKEYPAVKDGDSYFCNTTRSATINDGCQSGKITVKGTGVESSACTASEICQPYITQYTAAIICILIIVLPAAIAGTVFVMWCIHRRRKSRRNDNSASHATNSQEAGTTEEKKYLNSSQTSDNSVSHATNSQEAGTTEEQKHLDSSPTPEKCNGQDIITETAEAKLTKLQELIEQQNKSMDDLTKSDQSKGRKITDLQKIIDDLKQSDHSNKAEFSRLNVKIGQLQCEIEVLEEHLYPKEDIDYLEKPLLVHTIELSEKMGLRPVSGITALGTELFVITRCSQKMEVFDSETFQHQRIIEIKSMTDPLDIASSKGAQCLFVFHRAGDKTEGSVLRIDPSGNVLNQWPTRGGKGRLSTYGSNVILCLSDKQTITEYSPEGESIVIVRLSPAAKLNNPMHAIKVTRKCFIVSHGDFSDELHRVCIVDLEGEIKKECRKWKTPTGLPTSRVTMKVPLCLVEDNERSVIVADTDHNRILLLSSMLKYQRKLVEEKNGLKDFPVRLCFDDTQSRLFVAVNKWNSSKKQWEDGRVQVFNVK